MTEYNPKYLTRLAKRYLEIHDVMGQEDAQKWYREFLTPDLRKKVKPFIYEIASKRSD